MAQIGGKRLIVLGGGLSGLSYVHYLRNFSAALGKTALIGNITLLEANDYMGGSVKTNFKDDGAVHELGPRSIRVQGAKAMNTLVLIDQLGLGNHILPVTSEAAAAKNRYIYNNGQFYSFPSSFSHFFRKIPGGAKSRVISAILSDLRKEKMDLSSFEDNDPSIYDFVKYRFGEDAAEYLTDPLLRGITAGDSRRLSTKSLLGDLLFKEQTYGSVLKGQIKPPVSKMVHDELYPQDIIESKLLDKIKKDKVLSYNLSEGLRMLPDRLSNSLLNTNQDGLVSIYNRTRAKSIRFDHNYEMEAPCEVEVETIDGDQLVLQADHVISCIPASDFVKLLPEDMPDAHKGALSFAGQIEHAPVACSCVEFGVQRSKSWPSEVNSFGFLTHSKAGRKILGITFDSAVFPQMDCGNDSFRMTCMIGGAWFEEVFGTKDPNQVTEQQIEQIALEEIRHTLNIKNEPHQVSNIMWSTGIAQYRPGHMARLGKMRDSIVEQRIPLTLLGQSYDGVAINDVIFASRMAAYNFIKSL